MLCNQYGDIMTISQLHIERLAEDHFCLQYNVEHIASLSDEKTNIVKFVDDMVDALTRLRNKITIHPQNNIKITLEVGGSEV